MVFQRLLTFSPGVTRPPALASAMRSNPFLAQVLLGRCSLIAWYKAAACVYCLSPTSSSARVGTSSSLGGVCISLHNCVGPLARASCAGASSTASVARSLTGNSVPAGGSATRRGRSVTGGEGCPRSTFPHTSDPGVFVIADLDTLLIALYVELVDRIIPARGTRRRGPGRPPVVTDAGTVTGFGLANPKLLGEREEIRQLLTHQLANRPAPGTAVVTDKGLSGQETEQFFTDLDLLLIRPARKDEKTPRPFPNWLRQRVEAIIWTLKHQLGLED